MNKGRVLCIAGLHKWKVQGYARVEEIHPVFMVPMGSFDVWLYVCSRCGKLKEHPLDYCYEYVEEVKEGIYK